jgi:hypothetical protein
MMPISKKSHDVRRVTLFSGDRKKLKPDNEVKDDSRPVSI